MRRTGGNLKSSVELALTTATIATLVATASWAAETINYTYDPRGRLVKVERSGSINNGVKAQYKYDKAENRINVTVTSPNPPPP
jgi:YD repeat-containing protein